MKHAGTVQAARLAWCRHLEHTTSSKHLLRAPPCSQAQSHPQHHCIGGVQAALMRSRLALPAQTPDSTLCTPSTLLARGHEPKQLSSMLAAGPDLGHLTLLTSSKRSRQYSGYADPSSHSSSSSSGSCRTAMGNIIDQISSHHMA